MSYYIVGVDSGNTIGLAFLTLEGKVKKVISISGSIYDAIRIIEQEGKPAIIACDVNPASEFSIRLSSYFNAKISFPKKIIRESQKWQVIREYEKKEMRRLCKNLHQRDALFSAILAYRENQNLLRSSLKTQIQEKERLAYLMLQGYSKESALEIIRSKENNFQQVKQEDKKSLHQKPKKEDHINIEKNLRLEKENLELKKRIEILEQEKKQLLLEVEKLKNENYKQFSKDKEIKKLKFKLKILKRYLRNKEKKQQIITKKNEDEEKNLKRLDTDILMKIVEEYRQKNKRI